MNARSVVERRLQSFGFAFKGLIQLFRSQANARIHAFVALLVVAMGFFLGLPARDWAALVFAISLVLALEAVNTAIEALADRVAPDAHPLVARCKDAAAAAVLIAAAGAVVVGLLLLGPPLLAWLANP
ncbi:MAG: diacylglycerol kinase family protein [Deltaproteobacteria bacterium]|nr:diacylglycerol kinase family protein [Deltaproteobacteria bacterium]MBW2395298.1 diacylglycerol kinase family protein [Deltaproteobacteria bacterium]